MWSNASVVRLLIAELPDRRLDVGDGVLFVLVAGKALSKAARDVFGDRAVVARCRAAKLAEVDDDRENAAFVLDSLPNEFGDEELGGRPESLAADVATASSSDQRTVRAA